MSKHHRVITKKELNHFKFLFDKFEAWKKSANNDKDPSFVKFWNDTVGKDLDKLKLFLSENWLIKDKDMGLVDIKRYMKLRQVKKE